MLEVRDFIEKMKEEIRDYLPDDVYREVIIDDVEVVKMNDQKLHGLTFRMPGSDAAPTLYVDEIQQFFHGLPSFFDGSVQRLLHPWRK